MGDKMNYEINEEGYICEVGDNEPAALSGDVDYADFDEQIDAENAEMLQVDQMLTEELGETLKSFALPGCEKYRGVLFTHMKDSGVIYARVSKEIPV
jgi:hypothetical protein